MFTAPKLLRLSISLLPKSTPKPRIFSVQFQSAAPAAASAAAGANMQAQGYQIKQATPRTAENMGLMMGDVTLQVARQMLAALPKMASGTIVHDNACGNGIVTRAIMETQDTKAVTKIHATDIGATMCEATKKIAAAGPPGWADIVETQVMPAEDLKFGDDTFTHSYANFVIFMAQDPDKVASEMHRTMKKDGSVGFVTTWFRMPHEESILKAHAATRPAESKHLLAMKAQWKDPAFVRGVLEKVGFSVEMSTVDTTLSFDDTRKWCALTWGFIGSPVGGWTKEDEDRFDDAVEVMAKDLEASEYFTPNGKGGGQVKMIVNLATVHKK